MENNIVSLCMMQCDVIGYYTICMYICHIFSNRSHAFLPQVLNAMAQKEGFFREIGVWHLPQLPAL